MGEAHAASRLWGTYLGGSNIDSAWDVDFRSGSDYDVVGGTDSSSSIATLGSHDNALNGPGDAFLAHYDSSGAKQWSTYYGGHGDDIFRRLTHDPNDDIYAVGQTDSAGFIPTLDGHQISLGGQYDAMLVRFDSSGARVWGTYFGGSDNDDGKGICIDSEDNVYIVGYTGSSSGIATSGAHDTTKNSTADAFVAKFQPDGTLEWATYYGGSSGDTTAFSCAVDSEDNVYVAGYTMASTGIASGGHDNVLNSMDAFLVKFDSTGTRAWATYYGGTASERAHAVAVDSSDNVYIAGTTSSTAGIHTTGAHDSTLTDGQDAFIAKFNSSGVRQWGTYFGGSADVLQHDECFTDMQIFGSSIYLAGYTNSEDSIATTGAWDSSNNDMNTHMFAIFTTGGSRLFGSYDGGEMGAPSIGSVSVSSTDRAVTAASTNSTTGVATTGDTTHAGQWDAYMTYIEL